MENVTVKENEAGQRLDKLLGKILKEAPASFFYKMMRKKNITLNHKKATGKEIVALGDEIQFFLSQETFEKFTGKKEQRVKWERLPAKVKRFMEQTGLALAIVYEDADIMIFDKPSGLLSQKAEEGDISAGELLIVYLLEENEVTYEGLETFVPAPCNRLDRNTSGLLMAGKTLAGAQFLSEIIKSRAVRKFYRCIVTGKIEKGEHLKGFLWKDKKTNRVFLSEKEKQGARPVEMSYEPVWSGNGVTMLEAELITGRTHQIRAQLASLGHPIVGDRKYGDMRNNEFFLKKKGIRRQLLHSYRLEFPEKIEGRFSYLSGRKITGSLPEEFARIERL